MIVKYINMHDCKKINNAMTVIKPKECIIIFRGSHMTLNFYLCIERITTTIDIFLDLICHTSTFNPFVCFSGSSTPYKKKCSKEKERKPSN